MNDKKHLFVWGAVVPGNGLPISAPDMRIAMINDPPPPGCDRMIIETPMKPTFFVGTMAEFRQHVTKMLDSVEKALDQSLVLAHRDNLPQGHVALSDLSSQALQQGIIYAEID